MAMAQVQSANIVGFDTMTSVAGFNWIGPEFRTVGYNTVNIHDIELSGDAVDAGGADSIQFLNASGNTVESYDWAPAADTGEAKDGWFDWDEYAPPVKAINGGDGVMIYTKAAGVIIKNLGEVNTNGYTRTSVAGFNWIGNAFPVGMNINSISLSGENVDPAGGDTIQFLNASGNTVESYDWAPAGDTGEAKDGWFDWDEYAPPVKTLAKGEGVMIYTKASGVTITVPGVTIANN